MTRLSFYIFRMLVLATVLGLFGCSSSDKDKSDTNEQAETEIDSGVITLATEQSAVLYFQKRAKEIFEDNKEKIKNPKLLEQLDDKKNISAKRRNLRECYKHIQDGLTEEQQLSSVIYGKLENLGFLQDAWEVEVGQFEINMGACIDIKTGRFMVLWINQGNSISEEDNSKSESTEKTDEASDSSKEENQESEADQTEPKLPE